MLFRSLIAFVVLALYTYASGLRGTALIAIVKDVLIYSTVIAAVVVIPIELGGYAKIFASIDPKMLLLGRGNAHNLGPGWVRLNFRKTFGRPVKIINDAAMQALGSYKGGRMLFLGLGTGLGSAMIVDGVLEPMELAHLGYKNGKTRSEEHTSELQSL